MICLTNFFGFYPTWYFIILYTYKSFIVKLILLIMITNNTLNFSKCYLKLCCEYFVLAL